MGKSPLRYVLASSLPFPDPRKMFNVNDFVKRLKRCLKVLAQVGYLKEGEADKRQASLYWIYSPCGWKSNLQDFNMHGQASVGRSFSINRNIEARRHKAESLVAQSRICEFVYSLGGLCVQCKYCTTTYLWFCLFTWWAMCSM